MLSFKILNNPHLDIDHDHLFFYLNDISCTKDFEKGV